MTKINPRFGKELKRYGAMDFNACYNCGNCTGVCSLTTKDDAFPREMVRMSALGVEEEISGSLKPWLCYYCGECSTLCPQTANPGELMMSLRRYLTARYDWTGLSGLFYKYVYATIAAMLAIAIGVVWFSSYMDFQLDKIMKAGHYFEMFAIASVMLLILLPNIIRMWYFTVLKPGQKIPFKNYVRTLGNLFVHMFTQKRALGCDDNKTRWFEHFILVIGYLTLLFTTVFLDWFGTGNYFVIILGYSVSAIVFTVTLIFVVSRMKRSREISKHSQPSDWLFVLLLFLLGLTAFLVRLFIDLDIIGTNKWLYIIHFTILAQWALVIVPFGKWTHFLYRTFAIYFHDSAAYKGE